jgi:hypothetical protein
VETVEAVESVETEVVVAGQARYRTRTARRVVRPSVDCSRRR